MQLDYYRSPCPGDVQTSPGGAVPPAGSGRPRRPRRALPVLITFSVLILLCAAALIVLRVLSPGGGGFSWDQLIPPFDDSGFFVEIPDEFNENSYQDDSDEAATTIPRSEPAPGVQMILADQPEESLSFQEIYTKVIPSIVSIQAYGSSGAFEGTGVILTADGYVLTNQHIVSGCYAADVVLSDGTRYEAKLVGGDKESDLAVLKVDAQGLTPAEFGNSDQLRVGDTALAIGNPLGSDLFGTLTEGIISAINRDIYVEGYQMSLIQTTAALNPGNSGGALINEAGQVVGITNMKMMSDYETIEGLGFAIPTVWAKEVADALLAEGTITGRPTIGIMCKTVWMRDAALAGQDSGVSVESVTAHGPAAQAGVRPGDVILAANGRTVSDLEDLTAARDEAGVGGDLTLTIWRSGETLELTLILVEQSELN